MHVLRSFKVRRTRPARSKVPEIAYMNGCYPTYEQLPTRLSKYKRCKLAHTITMAQSPNATAQAMAAAAEAMLLGPGLKPPPGVIPNFIDPPSEAHWVYVVLPICLAVSTPFVLIRLYTAFFILKSHGWADCAYNPGMACMKAS